MAYNENLRRKNKYLREEELVSRLSSLIDRIDISDLDISRRPKDGIDRYHRFRKSPVEAAGIFLGIWKLK